MRRWANPGQPPPTLPAPGPQALQDSFLAEIQALEESSQASLSASHPGDPSPPPVLTAVLAGPLCRGYCREQGKPLFCLFWKLSNGGFISASALILQSNGCLLRSNAFPFPVASFSFQSPLRAADTFFVQFANSADLPDADYISYGSLCDQKNGLIVPRPTPNNFLFSWNIPFCHILAPADCLGNSNFF